MAVPQMIAGPHAYVFYSGGTQAFETHRPALASGTKFQAVLDRAIEQGYEADGLSRIADLLKK
ncbi:hypothetical protein [Streptomyces lunaelactis]|uniref:hypothetical protein n=1 Tax=Streptomyces lunaelactis TaxID=1535768 RepID=UPI00359FB212